jgi:hypothetical protein
VAEAKRKDAVVGETFVAQEGAGRAEVPVKKKSNWIDGTH